MSEEKEKYFCEQCGRNHELDSGVGQRHKNFARKGDLEDKADKVIKNTEVEDEVSQTSTSDKNNENFTEEEIDRAEEEVRKSITLADLPGINEELSVKLRGLGLLNPMDLANIEPKSLVKILVKGNIKGIKEKTAAKLINSAREAMGSNATTVKYMMRKFRIRKDPINIFTTGSDDLDHLIGGDGGGWLLGITSELFGPGGSGKSELALQACVNVFLPADRGGLTRNNYIPQVLIIDTEGTMELAVSRIPEMGIKCCEVLGYDQQETNNFMTMLEDNIFIRRAYSDAQQESVAIQEHKKMVTGERNYVLVIVDSLVNNFRVAYSDNLSRLAPRQRAINRHIKDLKDIVALTNHPDGLSGTLICTNQIQHRPTLYGDGMDNIGGNVVKHNLDIRIKLKMGKGNLRRAIQVDSSFRPGGEAMFTINDWGIGGETSSSSIETLANTKT